MCKQNKEKKKSKAFKIIRRVILGIAGVVVIGIIAFTIILWYPIKFCILPFIPAQETYDLVDIAMTEEERLADFKAAYEYAVLSNPAYGEYEDLYGFNFEEMYNEYCEYIRECEDDADFCFVLFTFLRNVPSGHTNLAIFDPGELRTCGFEMCSEFSSDQEVNSYLYSWEKYIEQSFAKYDLDNTESVGYFYKGGQYLSGATSGDEMGSVLLEINGKKPEEYALEPLQYYSLKYDHQYNHPYRDTIRFNDTYGEPVKIKLLLISGEVIEETVYSDEKFNFALELDYNYQKKDPEYALARKEEPTSDDSSASSSPSASPAADSSKVYSITVDDDNNLVYVKISSCSLGGMEGYEEEITKALEGHDNVILDFRGNGGGSGAFCQTYIYPYLFTDNLIAKENIIMGANDSTTAWSDKLGNRLLYKLAVKEDGTIEVNTETKYEGKADRDRNIYVLTDDSTFSSADICVGVLDLKENVTIIGSNTYGEGQSGSIFTGMLPASHLIVNFTPGHNTLLAHDNGAYGTAPDIICPNDVDAYRVGIELFGTDLRGSYENMLKWDDTLNKAIELINE